VRSNEFRLRNVAGGERGSPGLYYDILPVAFDLITVTPTPVVTETEKNKRMAQVEGKIWSH